MKPVVIGVDIGGMFTDLCVWDADGLRATKLLSTPDDPSRAVLEGVSRLVQGGPFEVVQGSTVATNALLERRGRRVADIAAENGVRAFCSHVVLPEFREFERASSTAVNAYVAPLMESYLLALEAGLRERGCTSLRVMQSNGGQISADRAGREAVRTILSGPAGGVVAAVTAAGEMGIDRVVPYDMGGTSTDVSLARGEPGWTAEAVIDGWPVRVPMLDIHTIGAGGGSIAWLDAGGALAVGPRSAGADPGPACHGRGEEPTVTDAHVVLGRIRPESFLGGEMRIDPERAQRAIEGLGRRMGLDAVAAAEGVLRVTNANMERAIKAVSAERGHDPREFWLVSFGGAGGLHACELAGQLGMAGVIVPAAPGVLSATGMIIADVVKDLSRTVPRGGGEIDLRRLRGAFADLMDAAALELQCDGYDIDDAVLERYMDLRYVGQSYELTVPVESLTDIGRFLEPFHREHERQYGHCTRDEPVEAVTVRVRARVTTETPTRPQLAAADEPIDTAMVSRVVLAGTPPVEAALYDRDRLRPGHEPVGPAILLEPHATTWLPPCWHAEIHPCGHIRCTRKEKGDILFFRHPS